MSGNGLEKVGSAPGADTARERREIVKRGISASPGIAIGEAFLKDPEHLVVPRTRVPESAVESEIELFRQTLAETRNEIVNVRSLVTDRMGDDHARIFDAHLMILDDTTISDGTFRLIREKRYNAAAAFNAVVEDIIRSFQEIEDEYLKDRYVDIKDIKRRLMRNLLGREKVGVEKPTGPAVVVAHDLSPSDTAQLDRDTTLAYATDLGGRTSHTAILARSQGLPAVLGLENLFGMVENGDTVIVDGNTGTVVINPREKTLQEYRQEMARYHELEEQLLTLAGYPATTLDDKEFMLAANIDMPAEAASVLEHGGQGVGLFRTEYFFISHEYLPSEEEQYQAYRSVVEALRNKPVVFRTLDIGGDKIASYLHSSPELNPFMGWRGIRFCLTRKDIFKTQLRALYRASAHGKVKIMFPMISQIEEVIKTKEICAEVREELRHARFKFDENVELGIMIETPSAVAVAEHLAREVAFFSIGTNDLIQYTMAVDRGNSKIAHLYQNLHPSIIRFLKQTVDAARKRDIHVSVCGEMCGDPFSILILIGLQIDEFSCSPNMIPEVKRIIRSVTFDECRALVRRVMRLRTTADIEHEVEGFLRAHVQRGSAAEGAAE